jgi:hypothetical protein
MCSNQKEPHLGFPWRGANTRGVHAVGRRSRLRSAEESRPLDPSWSSSQPHLGAAFFISSSTPSSASSKCGTFWSDQGKPLSHQVQVVTPRSPYCIRHLGITRGSLQMKPYKIPRRTAIISRPGALDDKYNPRPPTTTNYAPHA